MRDSEWETLMHSRVFVRILFSLHYTHTLSLNLSDIICMSTLILMQYIIVLPAQVAEHWTGDQEEGSSIPISVAQFIFSSNLNANVFFLNLLFCLLLNLTRYV